MDPRYAAIYPDLYRNHWWWRVRERMLVATIRRLVTEPPIRILDVGCGAGLFFDHFNSSATSPVLSRTRAVSRRTIRGSTVSSVANSMGLTRHRFRSI